MPRTNLYTLYDKTAKTVIGPIVAEFRHAIAVRAFVEVLADKNTLPGKYPEQFELRHIGSLDTDTGDILPIAPELVYSGEAWLRTEQARAPETAQS